MASIKSIARRTFLVGSAVVAGGVVFGTYMLRRSLPNPIAEALADGEATFNPWVKVTSKGVTLIAPHTDIGQGVRSMQAMLIAEELDIDLDQVEIDPGV